MPTPRLNWMEPWEGREWVVELRMSNSRSAIWRQPRLSLDVYTPEGIKPIKKIQLWEEPPPFALDTPYSVLHGLITVASQFQYRIGVQDLLGK